MMQHIELDVWQCDGRKQVTICHGDCPELCDHRPTGHWRRFRDLECICTKVIIPIVRLETLNELVFAASDSGTPFGKFDLQKVHRPLAVLIAHFSHFSTSGPRAGPCAAIGNVDISCESLTLNKSIDCLEKD
jgi:hypothetical protein